MAQQYPEISEKLSQFIDRQKMFFVGTATEDGRVNVSPKGMDSLRVLGKNQVIWLNVTGSGNETSAHVQENPRMTIMFCAFEGNPMILRLYGHAQVVHKNDAQWDDLYSHLDPHPSARQIFNLNVDLVQTSCGMAVPFYDFSSERTQLTDWAIKKGPEGVKQYWEEKNQLSLDSKLTHIMEKNT
jgi:Pyridoxamine 5'-phosphate oxidase